MYSQMPALQVSRTLCCCAIIQHTARKCTGSVVFGGGSFCIGPQAVEAERAEKAEYCALKKPVRGHSTFMVITNDLLERAMRF